MSDYFRGEGRGLVFCSYQWDRCMYIIIQEYAGEQRTCSIVSIDVCVLSIIAHITLQPMCSTYVVEVW